MKYHPTKGVLFCTSSIEEGVLLLANPLCDMILRSCLAAAAEKYLVDVCHFLFEGTHVHMIVAVHDPEDVPNFFRHFKGEVSHRINRILGRNKRTVWCEGYDSPIVLTPLRAVMAITYLYANPAKDNLESSIDRYPGLSSWGMYTRNETTTECKRVRRFHVETLPPSSHNLRGYTKEAHAVFERSSERVSFTLKPNAWLVAFGITDPKAQARWNDLIMQRIRRLEERFQEIRVRTGAPIFGAERLRQQAFNLAYRPMRKGRRTTCLSERRSVRQKFLAFFKRKMQQAREVSKRWRLGDYSVPYPPGLHPPSMPRLANEIRLSYGM